MKTLREIIEEIFKSLSLVLVPVTLVKNRPSLFAIPIWDMNIVEGCLLKGKGRMGGVGCLWDPWRRGI